MQFEYIFSKKCGRSDENCPKLLIFFTIYDILYTLDYTHNMLDKYIYNHKGVRYFGKSVHSD